jgi:hypothetical protein
MSNLDNEQLLMAEHQFLGFFHSDNGFSLKTLVLGMGLTREEFNYLCEMGAIPEEHQSEISSYVQ